MAETKQRLEALKKLQEVFPVSEGTSGLEDYEIYLENPETIGRWVAVTRSEDINYLTAFDTRREAEEYSVANISDDIYAEGPVALADLDDGGYRRVAKVTVSWGSKEDLK